MFLIKKLNKLEELTSEFQEQIFKKVFKMAEIAKYNEQERAKYIESLNQYRDLNNVIEYAKEEAKEEHLLKSIENGLRKGYELKVIVDFNNLNIEELKTIIKNYGLSKD